MFYVTEQELANQIGKPNLVVNGDVVDPRLTDCVDSATFLINDWCGLATDLDPVPSTIHRVALSLSVDLWKQPDATFGIIGSGETGPVRIARDLMNRYDSLLIPFYDKVNGWGVA